MRLGTLVDAIPTERAARLVGDASAGDTAIRGICIDSRAVAPGELFVALRGSRADGHRHLAEACRLGAAALLVDALPGDSAHGVPVAVVDDTRRALAAIATRFYGQPSDELELIGITGTNGKTSTSYLVESMLLAAGRRPGLIGTVEIRYAGERERSLNTTPESLDLQRLLRAMCNRGVETVAMEISSHGLSIGRTDGCQFAVGAFTNLSQDHLDFHVDMDAYRDAKLRLFREQLRPAAAAVIHTDDAAAPAFEQAALDAGARLLRVSRTGRADADVAITHAETTLGGSRVRVRLPSGELSLEMPLVGDFNLENLAVACGIGDALGLGADAIAEGAASCRQVPGRVERVDTGAPDTPTVLVDYAHTPDAVDKLLAAVRPLTRGRLITVFGCGGDRDRGKRAPMAKAAARWSDRVVATSDNPRTEDPDRILQDVVAGLADLHRVGPEQLDATDEACAVLADRRAAIALAISIARADDSVVIAGKGHEDYQIVGDERLPFDDRAEARRALSSRVAGACS